MARYRLKGAVYQDGKLYRENEEGDFSEDVARSIGPELLERIEEKSFDAPPADKAIKRSRVRTKEL